MTPPVAVARRDDERHLARVGWQSWRNCQLMVGCQAMLRTVPPGLVFEPCIPTQADRPPSGPGWIHEIKHDGFRLIARRDGAGVRLMTRNGHDWTARYPAIANAIGRLRCRSCVVDGEVAIVDSEGRAVFDRLQAGPTVKPEAILFAFDLLELNG